MKKEIRHNHIVLVVLAACLSCFWAAISQANNVPPRPTSSFYGDANGDAIIDASDITQMKLFTLALPYTYDTLQPQNSSDAWNTGDLTSDRVIDASDISYAKMWTLGFSISIDDKPWHLANINLPLTGNQPFIWVPFTANLFSNPVGGATGRPGFSVVAEIDPSSPTPALLLGRSCTPDSGVRDQQAGDPAGGPYNMGFGAQCALSVSVSNWSAGQERAYTESGTYGFQVMSLGVGTVKINLSVSADPTLDIPAVTLVLNPAFSPQVISPYNNVHVRVANNGGAYFNDFGNDEYLIDFLGGGMNTMHVSTSYTIPNGQLTTTTSTSGTFWITNTGGKNWMDEVILLVSVNAASLPSNFSVTLTSHGYRLSDMTYLNPALSETFGPSDFIYGIQNWKPSGTANYSLWPSISYDSYLMFVDLWAGIKTDAGLTESGQIKVDYVIQNLPGVLIFNSYGYRVADPGAMIQWTNSTTSGWRVTLP